MNKLRVTLSSPDIAKLAWHELKPSQTHENFMNNRVVRHKNMVIMMPRLEDWPKPKTLSPVPVKIVAYPNPEHSHHFVSAWEGVKAGGPADKNPGAIGTIQMLVLHGQGPVFELQFAQSHFKTGKPPHLPRSLATKYGGWKMRILEEIMKIAKGNRVKFVVPLQHVRGGVTDKPAILHDFQKAAQKTGMKVEIRPGYATVSPAD